MSTKVTSATFMTGVLAGLAQYNTTTISSPRNKVYEGFVTAFNCFEQTAPQYGVKTNFYFMIDELHGDSPAVHHEILSAAGRGLLRLEENLHILISKEEAPYFLSNLPGGEEPYLVAAKTFLSNT